jgi:hypothetical protein
MSAFGSKADIGLTPRLGLFNASDRIAPGLFAETIFGSVLGIDKNGRFVVQFAPLLSSFGRTMTTPVKRQINLVRDYG